MGKQWPTERIPAESPHRHLDQVGGPLYLMSKVSLVVRRGAGWELYMRAHLACGGAGGMAVRGLWRKMMVVSTLLASPHRWPVKAMLVSRSGKPTADYWSLEFTNRALHGLASKT